MPLAHTATSGGPNTEILLLGVGMVVLAAVFFFQKTASRRASVVLLVLGAAAITGAFTVASTSEDGAHHDVTIAIQAPADGATVDASEPVSLQVDLQGAELASETTDEDGGHLHVYVDGSVVDMPATLDVEVDLEPGEHEVEVEYVDAEHVALEPPVTDSVSVVAE